MINICLVSLGCAKNTVDSEAILALFKEPDFKIVNNYEELSKTTKLKQKNDYIKQLIFDKVSVAKFIKKKRPDIATNLLQETFE